jgi:uncharacterized membrane protein
MKTYNLIYIFTRCVIGVIFIYAGITKFAEPEIFAALIGSYGILPEALLLSTALGLSLMEILAGAGLLFDIRGSLTAITTLLLLFILVLAYGILMGLDIDCGCFGPADPEAKAYHGLRTTLYRDIILLAAIIYLYRWRRINTIKPLTLRCYLIKHFQRENL